MLIGPGDEDGRFRAQAAASPYAARITFTGRIQRANLGAFYRLADVFAFPSLGDTQALVVNEAACAATPVVMVDRKISQVVEDGVSGLFAANTAEDFAEKISVLLEQPERAAEMGAAARTRAEKLTARCQTAELARLYEETVSRCRTRTLSIPPYPRDESEDVVAAA